MTEGPDVEKRTAAPELIVRCAWCERIKVDDVWIDADVEAHALRLDPRRCRAPQPRHLPRLLRKLTPPNPPRLGA